MTDGFTHLNEDGDARMIDVGVELDARNPERQIGVLELTVPDLRCYFE